ncbi:MAG: ribose 5-phosphate isomerase B [Helicobacter sp.]|uniref:ribose 5-phosphate isomerase B n=1 Tax=Helicobacter sp. 10-6591 TaxID=2004998 RepID=UPI000DCC0B67|nr:ribose 5-phosphate isomerase B [Helicobacter sp. 10-6591]MCI6217268.1 ribose 5-phosphate isomerase B [Helicobacter sp.]RAX54551.1 ribose 5-phosphate isomerase B [Helicobacter sp. 10-6591]
MQIFIASDHAGFGLKASLRAYLLDLGLDVQDLGVDCKESVDYPDFANVLCQQVLKCQGSKGILICGSGIGMSIAANRLCGIRAALCTDSLMAKLARAHNDSNVLCLGQRIIGEAVAFDIVEAFLNTPFENGRHQIRVQKLG